MLLFLLVLSAPASSSSSSSPQVLDVHANPIQLEELVRMQRRLAEEVVADGCSSFGQDLVQLSREFLSLMTEEEDESPERRMSAHPLDVLYLYGFWAKTAPELKRAAKKEEGVPDSLRLLLRRLTRELPGEDELRAVALSVVRLQSVYNLSTAEIMDGEVVGRTAVRSVNKEDCFLLARVAREALLKDSFVDWHNRCTDRFVTFSAERRAREADRDRGLAEVEEKLGALRGSEEKAAELKKQLPMDMLAGLAVPEEVMASATSAEAEGVKATDDMFELYRRLCRSEEETTSLLPREEHCLYYDMGGKAHGRLAPARLEFLAYDPVVAVAHGIVGERLLREMRRQIASGRAGLRSPKSVSSRTGEIVSNAGRTGMVGFLPEPPADLARAAARLTGLSMRHAEPMQVVTYGVGGHYEPHVDYTTVSDKTAATFELVSANSASGDRTATLLYYLNDVAAGGATVFPRLGLGVRPAAGSALFWYNLYRNGSGDPYTLHAACPVLLGSKVVVNQWFRDLGQVEARPCALTREE